jgi:hypothetical protein
MKRVYIPKARWYKCMLYMYKFMYKFTACKLTEETVRGSGDSRHKEIAYEVRIIFFLIFFIFYFLFF